MSSSNKHSYQLASRVRAKERGVAQYACLAQVERRHLGTRLGVTRQSPASKWGGTNRANRGLKTVSKDKYINREGDSCISFISFMIISNSGSLGSNAAMQT